MEKLIFYCPSAILGGTEVLFSRLAINVSNENLVKEIFILDVNFGILSKLCSQDEKIKTLYDIEKIDDSRNTIIFAPAKCLHQLYKELENKKYNGRICIWQLGSSGLSETLFLPFWLKFKFEKKAYGAIKKVLSAIFFKSFNKSQKILYNLLKSKSLIFTDLVGALESFNDLNIDSFNTDEIEILPIFVTSEPNLYLEHNKFDCKNLNVGWVGRISCDFKIYSITNFINSISETYNQSFSEITFHVIGNGDAFHLVEKLKLEIEQKWTNVKIKLYGELSNIDSIDLLLKTSNLVIGMGTASLDVAKYGMPSVILSPITSMKDYDKVKYRWLYDSSGFSLGEFPNNIVLPNQISHNNVKVLIDDFILNHEEISKKTHLFIEEYFTTDIALRNFFSFLTNCDYSKSDFVVDFKSIYYNRIFFKKITNFYKPKWLPR